MKTKLNANGCVAPADLPFDKVNYNSAMEEAEGFTERLETEVFDEHTAGVLLNFKLLSYS